MILETFVFHLNCHGEMTALLTFLMTIPFAGSYLKMRVTARRGDRSEK